MKKQYVLLLLLLCGATLGASAQSQVQLGFSSGGIDTTICNGGSVTLSISQELLSPDYYYRLEYTNDTTQENSFVQVGELFTENSIQLENLIEGTLFYRVVLVYTSDSENPTVQGVSDTVSLVVLPPFSAGEITGNQTICYGDTPDPIQLTTAPSGTIGNLTYQWEEKHGASASWSQVGPQSQYIDSYNDTTLTPGQLDVSYDVLYRLKVSDELCNTNGEYTNEVTVHVLPQVQAGTLSSNQNICPGANPGELTVTEFTGGSTSWTYQWQESTDGGSWNDIPAQTNTSYIPQNITEDHWYRVVGMDSLCGLDTTNTIQIHIWDAISAPVIDMTVHDTTICHNGTAMVAMTNAAVAETDNTVTHRWQKRTDNGEWEILESDVFQDTLTMNSLTATTWFRVMAHTTCDTAYSDSVRVVVLPPFNPGHIMANDAMVCNGASGDSIFFDTLPSGYKGVYQIEWYENNQLTSQSGEVYYMNTTTAQKVIEARVSDDVCATTAVATNSVTINVYNPVVAGSILTPAAICAGTRPDTLRVNTGSGNQPFHGGHGDFTYQWKYSTSQNGEFTAIPGAEEDDFFQPDTLYATTYFRLVGTNDCGSDSTQVTVTVHPQLTAPTIGMADTTICYNSVPDTMALGALATGTANLFSYHWQWSVDDSTWTEMAGGVDDTLCQFDSPLTETTKVRVSVAVNANIRGCDTVYSTDTMTITVMPDLTAGSIVAADSVLCNGLGTTVALDTADMPAGADGVYAFHWQWSADGETFDSIASALPTDSSFDTPTLEGTTYYRVMVTNALCLDTAFTDTVQVQVLPAFVASDIVVEYDDPAYTDEPGTCLGTAPEGFVLAADTMPTGGSGVYSYSWSDGTTQLGDDTIYSPDTLWTTTTFYMTTTDSLCGSYTSNGITVEVWALPEERTLGGDTAFLCNGSQPVRYWVAPQENETYNWSSPYATFQDGNDSSSVYLVWDNGYDNVSLSLTLTETTHGCMRTLVFDSIWIDTTAVAPDTTDVLIKFGGNILVCNDATPNAHYQWGYTDRATGADVLYSGSDSRYFQTPDAIDTASRDYFVIVWYTLHCKTRSYYIPHAAATTPGTDDEVTLVVAPNPSFGDVNYILDADIRGAYTVNVFDAVGQLLFSVDASDYTAGDVVRIDRHLHQGLYVVSVATANRVVSQKIIVK